MILNANLFRHEKLRWLCSHDYAYMCIETILILRVINFTNEYRNLARFIKNYC